MRIYTRRVIGRDDRRPRPPTLSTRKAQNRAAILAAARTLFTARGFSAVGLEEVAAAAGLTRRTIYAHFPSKVELLVALVDHVHRTSQSPDFGRRLAHARKTVRRLELLVDASAAYLPKIEPFARMLRAARASEPAAEVAWAHRMRDRHRLSAALAAGLQGEGRLARGLSLRDADDLIWMLLSFDVYELLVVESGWSRDHYRRQLRRLLRAALIN